MAENGVWSLLGKRAMLYPQHPEQTWVLSKNVFSKAFLENPLDNKEIKPVNPKGNQP